MRQFEVQPEPALRPWVACYWGWESEPGETVALPTLLPGTGAELYLHYRRPFQRVAGDGQIETCPVAHWVCLRSQPLALLPSDEVGFIAVRFRVGGLHRFFPQPLGDFHDRILSAEDVWGAEADRLACVREYKQFALRLRGVETFLARQCLSGVADPLVERAAAWLYRHGDSLTIDRLADGTGIGRRQLERRFLRVTGLSPVTLRRLVRFQKTVRGLMLSPEQTVLDMVLAQGYADQAHWSREFSVLSGRPPGVFLAEARLKTHFYKTPHGGLEQHLCSD